MKKCTWCGQEFPNAARVCSTDGKPLVPVLEGALPEQLVRPATKSSSGRPAAITVICCLGFLGALTGLVTLLAHFHKLRAYNPAYPGFLLLGAIGTAVSMFGLFKMRRWGLYTYIVLCICSQIVTRAMGGHWAIFSLLPIAAQSILIAIGFRYLSKMK